MSATTARHALHDPIVVAAPEPEGLLALWVTRDDEPLWWVQAPAGSTELTVPAAPSTVDEAEYLGTGLVEGQLEFAEPSETSDLYLQRASFVSPLLLEP